MEHRNSAPEHVEKLLQINQAMFYCFNEMSEKIPVCLVNLFSFDGAYTLNFSTKNFPADAVNWESFAGEMHFYKKGVPYSFVLHGVIRLSADSEENNVHFTISQIDYFEQPGVKAADFNGMLSVLLWPYRYLFLKESSTAHFVVKGDGLKPLLDEQSN